MQAITTTYRGPTNTRGSRIIARCAAGRITFGYLHEHNIDRNHALAAAALRHKWAGPRSSIRRV